MEQRDGGGRRGGGNEEGEPTRWMAAHQLVHVQHAVEAGQGEHAEHIPHRARPGSQHHKVSGEGGQQVQEEVGPERVRAVRGGERTVIARSRGDGS